MMRKLLALCLAVSISTGVHAGLNNVPGPVAANQAGTVAGANFVGAPLSNSTTSTSMANNTPNNCTSISLPAGDWLVWGTIAFAPAASTTIAQVTGGFNTTSATLPAFGSGTNFSLTFSTGTNQVIPFIAQPFTFASTTTVFLVGQSQFGVSTMTCNGYIWAQRRS